MNNIKETVVTQAADTQQPQPPTITLYQQIAANLHKAVTEAISQIPGYDDDLSMVGELSPRRVVPPAVISATVSAIETNGPLTTDDESYVDETRKGQQFNEAFKTTVGLLAGVAQRIEFMMRCYDTMAGRGALRYYHVAKRLAKKPQQGAARDAGAPAAGVAATPQGQAGAGCARGERRCHRSLNEPECAVEAARPRLRAAVP